MSGHRQVRSHKDEPYAFSSDDEGPFDRSHLKATNSSIRKHSSPRRSPRKANSPTVSLLDFDRDYVSYSPYEKVSPRRSRSKVRGGGLGEWCRQCVKWVQSETWRVMVVGLVMGVVFAILYQAFFRPRASTRGRDNLLPCPSDELCIDSARLPLSLSLAVKIRDIVHLRAGWFDCGVKSVTSRNVTLEELTQQFDEEYRKIPLLRNAMYLVLYNPHWGIRWLDRDGNNKTRWNFPESSDILDSTHPLLSWRCYLYITFGSLWGYLRIVVIVVGGGLLVALVMRWYLLKRRREEKEVYLMVERILDLLKKHHITCSRETDLLPYLAIIHVRDTLIPPSERQKKEGVWTKACEWISRNESRVRVENQRIAGEDFLVWKWIQNDPPKTEDPVPVPMVTVDSGRGRGKNWSPWTAIDHYGPRGGEKVAPPIGTPSPFIRLKNMFDTIRMDDEQAKQIENAVLERCSPHGSVLHIYVDRKSTFGCVYFKMDSTASAAKAYRALHGGWYNGKLVTAKYIEESRYVKWFPHSEDAVKSLVPS